MHVGIISDLDDARASQLMTAESLTHVAGQLSIDIEQTWLTTTILRKQPPADLLEDMHAVWAGPGRL